jgi:prolyl-tRNA editing enzyme YbaK/EbsC (Cys-tRNA(Pro) deacylase)
MSTPEEIEQRVAAQMESLGVEHEMFEIDPNFADTAAFCERYGFPMEKSGNTIVVASKRGQKKHCACIVAATDRLDVNKRVKGLMEVSRASFAGADDTMELTGMMIGGVTPFGLPSELPIYADAKLSSLDYVIIGGGSRSSKIKLAPSELGKLPNLEFVEGLSLG